MKEIDNEIIHTAARGDSSAFRKLYDYYGPFVWKVVFRTVNGEMETAKTITQDVFVRLHSKLKSFKFNSGFSTWLFRMTYTTSMNHISRRKVWWNRNKPLPQGHEGTSTDPDYGNKDFARNVMRNLKPEERFLLVAREVDGVAFEELESITGKQAGALRVQLHRLKQQIREEYSHEYEQ